MFIVKRAGELLSGILDDKIIGKAKEYSKLFSAWEQLTKKYKIAAAADYSRIQDIKQGVLLVDADHPGWIQILQTKEHLLLSDLQKAFPELGITGIAFKLSKMPVYSLKSFNNAGLQAAEPNTSNKVDIEPVIECQAENSGSEPSIEKIKDGEFKEKLKNLGKSINANKKTFP